MSSNCFINWLLLKCYLFGNNAHFVFITFSVSFSRSKGGCIYYLEVNVACWILENITSEPLKLILMLLIHLELLQIPQYNLGTEVENKPEIM